MNLKLRCRTSTSSLQSQIPVSQTDNSSEFFPDLRLKAGMNESSFLELWPTRLCWLFFKIRIGELGERVVYLGREEEEDGLGEEMRGDPKKGGRTGKSRVEID